MPADLVTYLAADVALDALIDGRVYRHRIPPEPTFPLIVYRRVGTRELHASGYVEPRFQFDCWAETDTAADDVAAALRTALEGFHGAMGTTHVRAMVDGRHDDYDEDAGRWRVPVDARILYRGA
jgi:hypothetical protein